MVSYEWTLETTESEDIVDSDFADNLKDFDPAEISVKSLGLVRNEGNETAGLTGRFWAYVKDGLLPEYFSDELDSETAFKVPVKYKKQLAAALK